MVSKEKIVYMYRWINCTECATKSMPGNLWKSLQLCFMRFHFRVEGRTDGINLSRPQEQCAPDCVWRLPAEAGPKIARLWACAASVQYWADPNICVDPPAVSTGRQRCAQHLQIAKSRLSAWRPMRCRLRIITHSSEKNLAAKIPRLLPYLRETSHGVCRKLRIFLFACNASSPLPIQLLHSSALSINCFYNENTTA